MKNNALNKLPLSAISRDLQKEAYYGIKNITIYAYKNQDNTLNVVGQVFAGRKLQKKFCMIMIVYDHDGDVIESKKSLCYGGESIFRNNVVKLQSYFDGFPFKFYHINIDWKEISKIEIVPADSH